MLSDNKHIDDFLRDKYKLLETGKTSVAAGWEQMNTMLDQQPPKAGRVKKNTTRRVITYMGMAAIVTTVTYMVLSNSKDKATKSTGAKNVISNNIIPQKNTGNTVSVNTIQKKSILPKRKYNSLSTAYVKLFSTSDTVFQKPAAQQKNISGEKMVNDLYTSLQQPEQLFEVSTLRDTLLFGRDGTVIKVPAGSFYNGNKLVKGAVQISLTECYNYTDILAHQLYTVSNKKPLVSGGMIKINATENGELLKVFYNKPLSIAMPLDRYDPSMQLFLPGQPISKAIVSEQNIAIAETPVDSVLNGRDTVGTINGTVMNTTLPPGTISFSSVSNWEPAGQQQVFIDYRKFAAATEVKLFDLQEKVRGINGSDEGEFIVNANSQISDEKIKQLIAYRYRAAGLKKIIIKRDEHLNSSVKAKQTNVSITKDGFVATDSLTMNFEQALKEKLLTIQDSLKFRTKVKMDSIVFMEKRRVDSIAYVKNIEFNKAYTFNIAQMGWLNCDKFMRSEQPMVDFSIPLDPMIQKEYSRYQLVFTNKKAVLPGYYANGLVNFGKLPVGEPVQVVCITSKDGRALGCVQKAVIGGAAMASLKFEEMTPEIFKERVSKL